MMKHARGCHTVSRLILPAAWMRCGVLLLALVAMPLTAHARTLHALLVVIDNDADLGTAMKANQTQIERLLETIDDAGELRVELQTRLSSQNEAKVAQIQAWLDAIHLGEDDVLFLYFSGYGDSDKEGQFLFLQDGLCHQSDLAQRVRNAGECRLKLLITDACRASMALPASESPRITWYDVEKLFRDAEGNLIHLTSATGHEFGWVGEQEGGLFTNALMHALAEGLTSWTEVFDAARQGTAERFQSAYATLPEEMQASLQRKGIESQTPKAYELPNQDSDPPANPDEPPATLWHHTNQETEFTLSMETGKTVYHIKDYLTVAGEVTDDAYLILLNWDDFGRLTVLFPFLDTASEDNRLSAGNYQIPGQDPTFEIQLPGPAGTERLKILALRRAADSNAITEFFSSTAESRAWKVLEGQQRIAVEEEILARLHRMNPKDWAEAHREVELRARERPEPRLTPKAKHSKKTGEK